MKKIENEEKLKDFEQKGYRWLELCKNFILSANQAKNIALRGNFSEKKNFLKKIGSNLLLDKRKIAIKYAGAWKILDKSAVAVAALRAEGADYDDATQMQP